MHAQSAAVVSAGGLFAVHFACCVRMTDDPDRGNRGDAR
jgi:hypothetical protein